MMPLCLVSGEEGAQAFFVLFAYRTNQTTMFLPLRRFQLALLALTRVSGKEALNAKENHHEFMFEHDQGTWIGDDEIPFGENHYIHMLAGRTFCSNWVMATDKQPLALQEFLEACGSRKTGANSKTSTATKLDHGELASLLDERPRAEES